MDSEEIKGLRSSFFTAMDVLANISCAHWHLEVK